MRAFLISIWLPISVFVISYTRLAMMGESAGPSLAQFFDPYATLLLIFVTWPCGVPLTIALMKLYRRNRITSYILTVLLVPLTGMFALFGGLFGPFGVAAYSVVASTPAWVVLGIITLFQHRRSLREKL